MLNSVLGALSADLAIDPGSATFRIYAQGRGVVLEEPTVVAILELPGGRREVLATGAEAAAMEGRAPDDVRVVRPVQDGVVVDFEVLEAMMRLMMLRVQGRRLWVGPRVAIPVPYGANDTELRLIRDVCAASGAREVVTVPQPLAAAVGAGLPVDAAMGQMVLDVGAGRATVAVVSLGGVVFSRNLRVGGHQLDDALIRHIREVHGLWIPRSLAQEARERLLGDDSGAPFTVRGRHLASGLPRELELSAAELRAATAETVAQLADAVLGCLERIAPDLATDIADTGVIMTGGVAEMAGLDQAVAEAAGLPVIVAEDPASAVVRGAATLHAGGWVAPRATG